MQVERVANSPADSQGPLTVFDTALLAVVRELSTTEGTDFDNLPPGEQRRLQLEFLQSYYLQMQREVLHDCPPEFNTDSLNPIKVNPNLIELTVKTPDQETEQKLRLSADRKGMLAYFAALTQQKAQRFLNPWITRRELVSYTKSHYTLNQLDAHLFDQMAKEGILEVGHSKGYRLACDPDKLLEILQSDSPHHTLEIVGFEGWREPSPITVEEYEIPFLRELLKLSEGLAPGEYLDIPQLREKTGLGREWVYASLIRLETLGLIRRVNKNQRYRVEDLNLEYISKIVEAQEKPVVINIRLPNTPPRPKHIESQRAVPLEVKKEEEPEFPEVSWKESGVTTIGIEELVLDMPRLLQQLDLVLTADLRFIHVDSKDGKTIYLANLPYVAEIDSKIILGILDFLGLGPKELKSINKYLTATLSVAIRKLESSSLFRESLLSSEIKARLAGLIINDIVTTKEGEDLYFATVRNLLDEALAPKKPEDEPQETIPEKEMAPEPVKVEEKKVTEPRPATDERLRDLIGRPFERELLSALSQPSLFLEPSPPVKVYNYHRRLSNKSDFIPWEDLFALKLAFPNYEGDYHPHLTPAGALVAALYLDQPVHNRVLALEKSGKGALKLVTRYTANFLRARLKENIGERERQYIENCLCALE